ncbi:MAG TPA: choice-of-anchor D domain-containing protein [Terriglobales bacterium]|nr:choice-of-anchor D domain-containing protein [Terriglobales bacterium]
MAAFSITSAKPSARLPLARRGRLDFTVTNTAHRDLTARAHVVPEGSAQAGWFTIVGPQRESPTGGTHQFGVEVAVPIEAPAGPYRFRLDVVGVEDPDEYEGEGVWATIEVPPAPQPSRLPIWIVALAALLVVAILVGVYFRFIRQPPRPSLEVSASNQSFNSVPVGQGSTGSVVTIKNTGSADARVTAVMVGQNPSDFKFLASTCAGQPLAAGATCQVQVGFQPSGQGSRSATLVVKAPNAKTPPELTFAGFGQGTAAAVLFKPASVVITVPGDSPGGAKTSGATEVTQVPGATVVTVTNNGQTPVTIATVKLVESNPLVTAFSIVSACDGKTLGGQQSCQVVVTFTHAFVKGPTFSGQLLVVDDAPGGAQTVPITGSWS